MQRWIVVSLVCAWSLAAAKPRPTRADDKPSSEVDKLEKEYNALMPGPGKDADARVAVGKKLLAAQVKATGVDSMLAQRRRQWLATAYYDAGDFAPAEKLYVEIIARIAKDKGASARELREPLERLAEVYAILDKVNDSDAAWARLLTVSKQVDGDRSAEYAELLARHGYGLDYGAAQRELEVALKIYEALPAGTQDRSLIGVLQRLGMLYEHTSQSAKFVAAYDKALAITLQSKDMTAFEKISGVFATANIYANAGRKDLSAKLFTKAIEMGKGEIARLEKTKGGDADLANIYAQLATTYWVGSSDLAKAEDAFKNGIKAARRAGVPAYEVGLAALMRAQGRNKEALALFEKLTAAQPTLATFYDSMTAEVLRDLREYKRSAKLIDKYLRDVAKTYGKQGTYAYGLLRAVEIYDLDGNIKRAEQLLGEALELAENELSRKLRTGTDADHLAYVSQNRNVLDEAVSHNRNFGAKSAASARLGLTTLLRRKGRILDAAAASMATIRAKLSADDKKLLDELNAARAKLAKLSVSGAADAGVAKTMAALEDTILRLEADVSKKSAAYRTTIQAIDLASIQKLVPKDGRLVEFVNYEPHDPRQTYAQLLSGRMPRRYAAYVLGATGAPTFLELGDATAIDSAIERFRKALADPDNDQAATLGKALYDLTMAKIAPKLGGATNVLIAPDGALNVVPFSALVDDKKQFLIKTYTFTYLTSGRDLLRLTVKTKAQGGGVLFADPTFDARAPAKGTSRGRRSIALSALKWPQLPGTAAEADAVAKTYKALKVYRGEAATEGTIKKLKGPKILHIATHGFFLPDEEVKTTNGPPGAAAAPPKQENPLLRSGLAFAGANKLASGDDDGLLTALEASGLDLEGTKLVVLSACETGVGKVTNGDGVYGLRRSLVIAGAESLVMSMWQVDDFATKELMAGFYKKLAAGSPRSAALRETQLELLSNPKYAHPFYWAAFLPAGATTPLKD